MPYTLNLQHPTTRAPQGPFTVEPKSTTELMAMIWQKIRDGWPTSQLGPSPAAQDIVVSKDGVITSQQKGMGPSGPYPAYSHGFVDPPPAGAITWQKTTSFWPWLILGAAALFLLPKVLGRRG